MARSRVMATPRCRLVGMWDWEPVGVDARRLLAAFAAVAMLCAVLMMSAVGRGDVLGGLFHAPRPISAGPVVAPTPPITPTPAVPEGVRSVRLPAELIAHPVGRATLVLSPMLADADARTVRRATPRVGTPDLRVRHNVRPAGA